MKKLIAVSLFVGVFMLGLGATQTHAAGCGAKGGIKVTTINKNFLSATQVAFLAGNTGGNAVIGSIGTPGIISGSATNTNTMVVSGNTNSTSYAVTSPTGATNTTTVVNSAPFVSVCTSAAN